MSRTLHFMFWGSLGFAVPAAAQDFCYPDFTNVTGLVFNGDADQSSSVLRLTESAAWEIGSAWYDQPMSVAGGFDTTFEFQMTALTTGGADGMAFVIQNDPLATAAIAEGGGHLGYSSGLAAGSAIVNSLVVEIDTWENPAGGDISGNSISVHTNGTGPNDHDESFSIAEFNEPEINMSDGAVHALRISYTPGTIEVYLDDLITPVISVAYDFARGGRWSAGETVGGLDLIGGNSAYVGFTGATSDAWENHDLLSWEWDAGIGTNFCVSVPNSSGSVASISAQGSDSIGAADMSLVAQGCPANVSGIFFLGTTQTVIPFGDGFRCIALPISRIPPIAVADPDGVATRAIDFGAPYAAAIQPGVTVTFQYWYRDAAAMASGFNLTDGVEVAFVP